MKHIVHLWKVIAPIWFSTDDIFYFIHAYLNTFKCSSLSEKSSHLGCTLYLRLLDAHSYVTPPQYVSSRPKTTRFQYKRHHRVRSARILGRNERYQEPMSGNQSQAVYRPLVHRSDPTNRRKPSPIRCWYWPQHALPESFFHQPVEHSSILLFQS